MSGPLPQEHIAIHSPNIHLLNAYCVPAPSGIDTEGVKKLSQGLLVPRVPGPELLTARKRRISPKPAITESGCGRSKGFADKPHPGSAVGPCRNLLHL